MNFVISDTHFGHKKILEFEPLLRPFASIEEHDETLVERWNDVVRHKDTVWHLGDVSFSKDISILGRLNGRKMLVMGNHDTHPAEEYLKYFDKLIGAVRMHGYIFTHIPVHTREIASRFKGNIHGHLHAQAMDDHRYRCVSVEQCPNLAPMLLDQVMAEMAKKALAFAEKAE